MLPCSILPVPGLPGHDYLDINSGIEGDIIISKDLGSTSFQYSWACEFMVIKSEKNRD